MGMWETCQTGTERKGEFVFCCSLCILKLAFEDKTVVIASGNRLNINLMVSGLRLILICSWPFYCDDIELFTQSDLSQGFLT